MASWDDVIQDIIYENEKLTPAVLKASIERHPEHRWDLIDFFTWWWADELLPRPDPEEPLSDEEKAMIERVTARAMARVRELDAARRSRQAEGTPRAP